MRIKIWGARGSLPYGIPGDVIRKKLKEAIKIAEGRKFESEQAIEKFIDEDLPFTVKNTYGSNTACVQVLDGDEYMICDAGSGMRDLASYLTGSGEIFAPGAIKKFNVFISHLHWDHTMGFPFFIPAYIPDMEINFYGGHRQLKRAFMEQQEPIHFPVRLNEMAAKKSFNVIKELEPQDIGGFKVTAFKQIHPGGSFGFKFEKDGKVFVYSTDAEHSLEAHKKDYEYVEFIKNADVLVFDAMYSHIEAMDSKLHWGHSSNLTGVELAERAGVKHLILFHTDFKFNDFELYKFMENTKKYLSIHSPNSNMKISTAYDGMVIEI